MATGGLDMSKTPLLINYCSQGSHRQVRVEHNRRDIRAIFQCSKVLDSKTLRAPSCFINEVLCIAVGYDLSLWEP